MDPLLRPTDCFRLLGAPKGYSFFFGARLSGKLLDQLVEKGLAFVECPDTQPLVAPVEADVAGLEEYSLHAVGGDAGRAQVHAVGPGHDHDGNRRDARPERFGHLISALAQPAA